jgi:transcriptional regulator with XRE-family HTH domain
MSRRQTSQEVRAHGLSLGRAIKRSREEQSLSAAELAGLSRVSVDTVRSLECGRVPRPSFLTVARLAAALGLSLDELQALALAPPGKG